MDVADQDQLARRVHQHMRDVEPPGSAGGRTDPAAVGAGPAGGVAHPGMSDEAIRAATGRGWDGWREVIDRWPGNDQGHTAIASHVQDAHGIDGWWAQAVTVGYERITGRRLPFQRPDGTFSANRSRTVTTDAPALRALLSDDDGRALLFPGVTSELRSRAGSRNVRLAIGPGTAEIALEAREDGRTKVTIAHERLPSFDDVEVWKSYWSAWLTAIGTG